jgi:hypothetical protein
MILVITRYPYLRAGCHRIVTLSNAIDGYVKVCHIQGLAIGSVQLAYVDWHR